jgi:hypothetical protein
MAPGTGSMVFSLVGLLIIIFFGVLGWLGLFTFAGLLTYLLISLVRRFPGLERSIKAVGKAVRYEVPRVVDQKELSDAVKSRLTTMEKMTWYILGFLGTSFLATVPGVSTVKIPTLEIPIGYFGIFFYAIFVGVMIYYVKVISSLRTIFAAADDKSALRFQLATNSGFLSPFTESASLFGKLLDILGFSLLIAAWWVAFAIGVRLLRLQPPLDYAVGLVSYLPWVSVVVGLFALFTVRAAIEEFSNLRYLYFLKVTIACVSLPCAWLIARSI